MADKMMRMAGRDENGKARPLSTDSTGKQHVVVSNTSPIPISGKDENGRLQALNTDSKGILRIKTVTSNSFINKVVTAYSYDQRENVSVTDISIINTNPYCGVVIKVNGGSEIPIEPGQSLKIEAETVTSIDYRSNLVPVKLRLIGGFN